MATPRTIELPDEPATPSARRPRSVSTSSRVLDLDYRPSYLAAAIAATTVLLLYLVTLSPSTAMWDTSEYLAAAYTLGLPHPPGNPFFVLIGNVFGKLPIAPTFAMRINILAALCSAVSAGMWFLITERVLVSWLAQRWQRIVGGSMAALIGATAFTVWNQSVVNEKVYTVSLVGLAICSWLTVRWCDDPDTRKADRLLVLVGYLLGLGYANHMAGMLAAPAVLAAVLLRRPATLLRWKLILAIAAATLLGITPFATQPIRAAHFPAINEGEPTGCVEKIGWSCTFSARTKTAFMYNFNRGQYGKPDLAARQAPLSAQVGMWWLYFKWQWIRDPQQQHSRAQGVLAALFLVLGLFGGYVHWRRDRQSFWFFGPLMATMTVLLIYYLNFKYGYSQSPELGDTVDREVRDRDYFYLWSFSAWSVWAALGLVFIWESVAELIGSENVKLGGETVEQPKRTSWLVAAPVLAFAFIPLFANWTVASRSGQTDTRDFAHDLLNSVEPYGILVTVGDNDTFPLWYAQEVEGIRKDVIVANTSLLNTDWYTRQLIRRPVFEYDAAKGPAVYRGQTWTKPVGPPLNLTMEQADLIPLYQDLPQAALFRKDSINAVIQPHTLQRADLLVLRMIADGYPTRPIYFSRTSGGYAQELGLFQYLATQGLARKLMPTVPRAGGNIELVAGDGFMDVERTRRLWTEVFVGQKSIGSRKDGWVDRPSVGIPYLYVTTGAYLADALAKRGDMATSTKVLTEAEKVAKAVTLEGMLSSAAVPPPAPIPSLDQKGQELPVKP